MVNLISARLTDIMRKHVNVNPRPLRTLLATFEQQCKCCEEKHKFFSRGKFRSFNCLRLAHRLEDCDGSKCKQCARNHHALLHREKYYKKDTNQQTTSGTTSIQAIDNEQSNATATTAIAKKKDENKFTGTMIKQTSEEVFLQSAIVTLMFMARQFY